MRSQPRQWFFSLFIVLSFIPPSFAATYAIDNDHTAVSFRIRHLLSHVQGRFNDFEGGFAYDPEKPETWTVKATVQAASIDTNVAPRDKHLRSADFLDAEKFPTLTFQSTQVSDVERDPAGNPARGKLHGLLSIHGIEKEVVFDLEIHGVAKDPWGNTLSSFTAAITINRKDFGLTWNEVLESGQVLVGEEVQITLEVEGILQEENKEALAENN